jgi:hypothetical protein
MQEPRMSLCWLLFFICLWGHFSRAILFSVKFTIDIGITTNMWTLWENCHSKTGCIYERESVGLFYVSLHKMSRVCVRGWWSMTGELIS